MDHSATAAGGHRLVYHDGAIRPEHEAVLPMGSIAVRYGVSAFEGVRLYRTAAGGLLAWKLDDHIRRLRHSCKIMGLYTDELWDLPSIVQSLVERNGFDDDCYARIAVSAGNAGDLTTAAEPVLTVTVSPSGRKKWLRDGDGMRLTVSTWQRTPVRAFPSAAKNISAYAGPRLAHAEARAAGFDNCLLTTPEGLVSEAPTATVFLVEDGTLVTPRLRDLVLPGITRAWVLRTAEALGMKVETAAVEPDRVRGGDEVFLCGTGVEFATVKEIDGRALGAWPSCPVTTELVDRYFAQVRGTEPETRFTWAAEESAEEDADA